MKTAIFLSPHSFAFVGLFLILLVGQRAAFRMISGRGKILPSPNNNPKFLCCYSGTIFLAMLFEQEIFMETKAGFVLKPVKEQGK